MPPIKPRLALPFLLLAACSTAVHAQPAQTADGAQAFLRAFFDNRSTGGRWLVVSGQVRLVDESPALLLIAVSQVDNIDQTGTRNACTTAIRALDYGNIVLESNGTFYNRGDSAMPAFPGIFSAPQYLNWGEAAIVRGVGTTSNSTSYLVSATFRMNGQSGPNASFRLSTPDKDMADRIEYAMKFLKLSCDASASTGF